MLTLAVAGGGVIGRRHIALIEQNPRTRLGALVDPAPAAAVLAAAHGVPHFESLALMWAQAAPKPDGVILATPNGQHVAGALECLRHATPALIEKPLADRLDAARNLLAALQGSTLPMLVGHHRRHSTVLGEARRVVASGELGRIVSVSGTALFCKPDAYFEAGPWRTRIGAGPILINLVHEIDNLRFLCGEITAVQAMASNAVRGFEVEDSAAITLRFASAALGSFSLSDSAAAPRSWEQTSGEDKAYARYADQDCCFIAGTQGSLAVPTLRRWRFEGLRSWHEAMAVDAVPFEAADPLARQLDHFCDVIDGRCAPWVSVDDAARSLSVTLAVVQAVQTGRTVAPEAMAGPASALVAA